MWWKNYFPTFSKKLKLCLWINGETFCSLFLLHSTLRAIEIYRNKATYHLVLPHIKLFKKAKRGLELVFLPHFLHDF